jgi:hypothetical protein
MLATASATAVWTLFISTKAMMAGKFFTWPIHDAATLALSLKKLNVNTDLDQD